MFKKKFSIKRFKIAFIKKRNNLYVEKCVLLHEYKVYF